APAHGRSRTSPERPSPRRLQKSRGAPEAYPGGPNRMETEARLATTTHPRRHLVRVIKLVPPLERCLVCHRVGGRGGASARNPTELTGFRVDGTDRPSRFSRCCQGVASEPWIRIRSGGPQ